MAIEPAETAKTGLVKLQVSTLVRTDDLEAQMRAELIARGWTPPGENVAGAKAAPREVAEWARDAAAVRTLETMGYTYHGAELWKPPLGKAIDLPDRGPDQWHLGVQNDTLYIIEGEAPARSGNDYPNHEADRKAVARVLDEQVAGRLVSDANAGRRYWQEKFTNYQDLAARTVRDGVRPELASELIAAGWRHPSEGGAASQDAMRQMHAMGYKFDMTAGRWLPKADRVEPHMREAQSESDAKAIAVSHMDPGKDLPIVDRYIDGVATVARMLGGRLLAEDLNRIDGHVRAFYTWMVRRGLEPREAAGGMTSSDFEGRERANAEQAMTLLRRIGLLRQNERLHVTIDGLSFELREDPWNPRVRPLIDWMMNKTALVHAERDDPQF